jgi:hypothetical protein
MADGYKDEIRKLIGVIRAIDAGTKTTFVAELIAPVLAEYDSIE